jgi:ectoine hydroxylase-related dioxygenase (phytanoyl-CoA dioxygenase family)
MTPEDRRAWYARIGDTDEQVCVRVTGLRADELETPLAERLAAIAAITGDGHRLAGTDLLVKPVGVTEGISDLPWHKDCALGMHSYKCRSLTCGVSVTASGPDNGRLGVVAGSHRVNIPLFDLSDRVDLPVVEPSTEVGDVTCTLHCATPPRHSERRVTYSALVLPGDTAALDEKVRQVRDQAGRDTYAPA